MALREMQMHADQQKAAGALDPSFTVKMTGGPDGDVAGNMIKILQREYGSGCRVVGLADATGKREREVRRVHSVCSLALTSIILNMVTVLLFHHSS